MFVLSDRSDLICRVLCGRDCVRANTQATTYMIAERIAAVIKSGGDLEAAIAAVSSVVTADSAE